MKVVIILQGNESTIFPGPVENLLLLRFHDGTVDVSRTKCSVSKKEKPIIWRDHAAPGSMQNNPATNQQEILYVHSLSRPILHRKSVSPCVHQRQIGQSIKAREKIDSRGAPFADSSLPYIQPPSPIPAAHSPPARARHRTIPLSP